MSEQSLSKQLKLFGMQNLMLEAALTKIEKGGVEIAHIRTLEKDEIVDAELFELDIRKSAERMAQFYILYYCLENSIRGLIKGTMFEKYGADWWKQKVPEAIKTEVSKRQEQEKNTAMSARSNDDPLSYTTLGELIPILDANWIDFSDKLRSRKAAIQTLSQINQGRSVIAHSCELPKDEIMRFELLIRDWQRIQT